MTKSVWTYAILPCLLFTACGTDQTQSKGAGNRIVATSPTSPTTTAPAPMKEDPIYYGKWKIDHIIARSNYGNALSQDKLNQMLGEEVEITAKTFKSDQVLQNPKYTITHETIREFFDENRMNPKDLGIIGDTVKVSVSSPTDSSWEADASNVYVKDKNTMMFDAAGVMISMIRE